MKASNVKVTVIADESGSIPIEAFSSFVDISKVVYYDMEFKDGNIILQLFDENKELIDIKGDSK